MTDERRGAAASGRDAHRQQARRSARRGRRGHGSGRTWPGVQRRSPADRPPAEQRSGRRPAAQRRSSGPGASGKRRRPRRVPPDRRDGSAAARRPGAQAQLAAEADRRVRSVPQGRRRRAAAPPACRRGRPSARPGARRCGPSASAARPTERSRPGRPRRAHRRAAAPAAQAGPPTCSRRWRRSPAATPTAPSALMAAADAFAHDRERETLRILRPLREQLPDSPSVRELTGLGQYRIGNYAAAAKELEAYADLSDSVDQNPVLMDCYRAQRRWRKVEDRLAGAGRGVADGRARRRGPHRLRRRARRPGPPPRGARPAAQAGRRKRPEGVPPPPLVRARRPRGARRQPRPGPRALPPGAPGRPAFADVAERLAALG